MEQAEDKEENHVAALDLFRLYKIPDFRQGRDTRQKQGENFKVENSLKLGLYNFDKLVLINSAINNRTRASANRQCGLFTCTHRNHRHVESQSGLSAPIDSCILHRGRKERISATASPTTIRLSRICRNPSKSLRRHHQFITGIDDTMICHTHMSISSALID